MTTLFAFIVLLTVLVFVHELGHFAVAKACGVRVLKFSIGFGSPLGFGRYRLRWKRGGTEYVIGWFPLGGFVKMLGENPGEEEDEEVQRADPSEALGAKALWQKLAIVFAGPAMNLLLPVVVFTITLAIGLTRPAATLGLVESGSPAAEVGLEAGDRIVSVDGEPVAWWSDIGGAVRSNPGETLTVVYERGDRESTAQLAVGERSGLNEFGKVEEIGWAGLGHSRLRAMVGVPDAGAPAQVAGLRSGDVVTAVAGEPVEDWAGFAAAYAAAGAPLSVDVERGSADAPERLSFEVPNLGDLDALGVVPASVLVSAVTEGSAAAEAGLAAGDLILTVDGELVGSFLSFAETVRTSEGRALDLVYAREVRLARVSIEPRLTSIDVGLGLEEERYLVGITAAAATLPGAVGVDRVRNPLVAIPRAVTMTVDVTRMFLRGLAMIVTGEVSRSQVAGPIGIAQIAGKAFERGWETYLSTMVLISINLGILNLLPIPVLDGGQALLFTVEGIKRSPLSLRTRLAFQQIGLTVLLLLMGLAFWNDLSRVWSQVADWLNDSSGL